MFCILFTCRARFARFCNQNASPPIHSSSHCILYFSFVLRRHAKRLKTVHLKCDVRVCEDGSRRIWNVGCKGKDLAATHPYCGRFIGAACNQRLLDSSASRNTPAAVICWGTQDDTSSPEEVDSYMYDTDVFGTSSDTRAE